MVEATSPDDPGLLVLPGTCSLSGKPSLGGNPSMTVVAAGHSTGNYGGESIVVERVQTTSRSRGQGRKRYVVDLGRKGSQLHDVAVRACPDVVVLTHDDDDHIGGAAVALRTMTPHIHREIWLPADWLLLLVALAAVGEPAPDGTKEQQPPTLDQVREAFTEDQLTTPPPTDPDTDDVLTQGRRPVELDARPPVADPQLDELLDRCDIPLESGALRKELERIVEVWQQQPGEPEDALGEVPGTPPKIAARAAKTPDHVSDLVDLMRASRTAGRVRWFSPDRPPAGRGPLNHPEVHIVNAGEVPGSWRPPIRYAAAQVLLLATTITVHNERSLVTFVEPTADHVANGVLVWSDSTGRGHGLPQRAPWERTGLMTAPHHGSAQSGHHDIWVARAQRAPDSVVLLSNNSQPTTVAYTVLHGRHACTHCPRLPTMRAAKGGRDAVAEWCAHCNGWKLSEDRAPAGLACGSCW